MRDFIMAGFGATVIALAGFFYAVFGGQVNPSPPIVAREPGVAYDVLAFCNDPATKVGITPMTDAPAGGNRYIANRGTETINWPDSPVGVNSAAMHYYIDSSGVQQQEPVEMTKPAAECFQKKAK